ncbi:MAG TPA: response regulator [Gemmatimonadaceae bacterium]|nr:response regulator [Gemmatimonadaceae bacterium]
MSVHPANSLRALLRTAAEAPRSSPPGDTAGIDGITGTVTTLGSTGALPPWWPPLLLGVASIGMVSAVIAIVRRRSATLLSRARTAEAAAQRVLSSEERFRRLFDRGADPQLLTDGERIVAANPAATMLLSDGAGRSLIGIATDLVIPVACPAEDDHSYDTETTSLQGESIPVALRRTRIPLEQGELLHYQLRDLRETRRLEAERRELEAQLLASQRLEALGTLAGGVAHDFNNLLTVIRANAEVAQISLAEDDRDGVSESLLAMMQASDRARDIVKQILLFSRRSVPARSCINLAALITDAQTLLRATIPSTVQLLVEVRSTDTWINGDATQMQQLLLNLCSNAEHAMRETNGGMLRITVDCVTLDESHHGAHHPQLPPGRYVRLLVRDTGGGMADDVRQRIFEPFFTTKPIGEGTGLGLAVLHGIVMSHNGSVYVDSVAGRGTHFELLFGLVTPPVEGASVMFTTPPGSTSVITPRDRVVVSDDAPLVLLVDDEPSILRAAERGIRTTGMRVLTASSGREALRLLAEHDDVSVLITDQTMPEMTGLTLADHVRTLRPSLPMILSTGYTGRVTPDRLREAQIDTMLDKPYTLSQLTEAIQSALRASRRRRVTQRA